MMKKIVFTSLIFLVLNGYVVSAETSTSSEKITISTPFGGTQYKPKKRRFLGIFPMKQKCDCPNKPKKRFLFF